MDTTTGWCVGRRRRATVFAIVGLLVAAATGVMQVPTRSAQAATPYWLTYLNGYRSASGLTNVAHNTAWDAGTKNHSCYMNLNGITHYEEPGKPGYTASGAEAGKSSNVLGVLGAKDDKADQAQSIDLWMGAPYHALYMLYPNWKSTSLGICYTPSPRRFSATLDVIRGNSFGNSSRAVTFPGNNATTHLYRFMGESPNPTANCSPGSSEWGLPLIAMFPKAAKGSSATISGPGGAWRSADFCVLDSDKVSGIGAGFLEAAHAVLVIPRKHLTDGNYKIGVTYGTQKVNWGFAVKRPTPPTTTTTRPPTTTTRPTTTTTRPPTTTSTTTTTTRPPTTTSTTTTTTRPPTTTSTTTTTTRPPTTTSTTTTTTRPPTTTSTTTTTTRPPTTTTTAPNRPPVAMFDPGTDQYVDVGDTIKFDGSTSYDPEGWSLTYEWRITGDSTIVSRSSGYTLTVKEPRRYGVELTVRDERGGTATKHIDVWVSGNQTPVASFTPGVDQFVDPGDTLTFDGSASTDPEGWSLTYEWRTTGESSIVSRTNGYSRTFNEPGRYGVELTVIDAYGGVGRKHINVWVSGNQLPVPKFTPEVDQFVDAGATLTFDGSASYDPDGGPLVYEWRTTGESDVVSDTNSYVRRFNKAGRFGVELTVKDIHGGVAKQHINVWVTELTTT